jgi:DNA-binding MarR family transcriptional regulator
MSKERRPWNPYPLASLSVGSKFDLSPAAISVLIYLAVRSNHTGTVTVGQARVASDLQRSKGYVTEAIKELVKQGVISLERRDRRKGLTSITLISPSILPVRIDETVNPNPEPDQSYQLGLKAEDQSYPVGSPSILTSRTEPVVVLEPCKSEAQPVTTTTTSLLCCAPAPASLETQNPNAPEVTVCGYTLSEIKAHLETLVEFGHKWATENADGLNRLHPKWVEHVMTLRVPRGAKRRWAHTPNAVPHVDLDDLPSQKTSAKFKQDSLDEPLLDTDCTANRHKRGTCPSGAACHPNAPAYRKEHIEFPSFHPEPEVEPLCASCGNVPPARGWTYCKPCAKAEKEREAAEKEARRAARAAMPSLKEMMDAQ